MKESKKLWLIPQKNKGRKTQCDYSLSTLSATT